MKTNRTLAMGDIHGNLDALHQCLKRCQFDMEKDTLIQLGDVSDRHEQTAEVVESLLRLPSLIALRGNHDFWTREWLVSGKVNGEWLKNGGAETIKSYKRAKNKINLNQHVVFFSKVQQDYFIDSNNRVFVHGGFTHPQGPSFEKDTSVCFWDRELWFAALRGKSYGKKPSFLDGFKEIYIGHTPTLNWHQDVPMNAFNVWNLDTGAGTSGKLTVMDIDTKEYWQSEYVA